MWIVDTSVWVDYLKGVITPQTELLNQTLGRRELGLGDIILCEVLQGFRTQRDFEDARTALMSLTVFTMGGTDIAIKSATNYRTLRQLGITVRKTIDCFIATYVIEHGHILLHNDRDFEPFEKYLGLSVVKP